MLARSFGGLEDRQRKGRLALSSIASFQVIGNEPLPIQLHIRNVGDESCRLQTIRAEDGLAIDGDFTGRQVPPRSADSVARGVVLEPYTLPAEAGAVA